MNYHLTKTKKVLFTVSGLERGGLEMRLLDLARYFPVDLEMHICVTSDKSGLMCEFEKTRARIKTLHISKPYLELAKLREFINYIRQNEIKTLNSFDLQGLLMSVLAKMSSGAGVQVVHHFVDLLHSYNVWQNRLLWMLMRFVDFVICNSKVVREEVVANRLSTRKVNVITNGVDCDYFHILPAMQKAHLRASLGYGESNFVIGTIANFREEKNYGFLIRNFRKLEFKYPQLRLLCVGGGPQLEEIRNDINRNGVADKIILTGYVQDVRQYLGAMDAFVLCSSKEGFPNSVLQAMATGVPVVCSRVGEFKIIIQEGETGLLFGPSDESRFSEHLELLIANRAIRKRLTTEGRRLVENEFALKQMVQRYVDFYFLR